MTHVRKHRRTTRTGQTTKVRDYERSGPDRRGLAVITGDDPAGTADGLEARQAAELDAMKDEMRWWRSQPEPDPGPDEPMSEQMTRAMGCDTPEGRAKYERLRAYREAGYEGPLDQDNRIPDPDDPASARVLDIGADMRARRPGQPDPGPDPAADRIAELHGAGYDGPFTPAGEPADRGALIRARTAAVRDLEDARTRLRRAVGARNFSARSAEAEDAAEADYLATRARLEILPPPDMLPATRLSPGR